MEDIKLKTERIKAVVTIVITAFFNVLNVLGWAADAEPFILAATSVISAVSIVWCWWFNQNMTQAAVDGQKVLNAEKAEK